MITQEDRDILRDVGREYLLDIAIRSNVLRDKLTFREHVDLCKEIAQMSYEDVISITITEGIKEFEGKFKKFLKYSFFAIAGLAGGFVGGLSGIVGGPPLAMFVLYIFRKLTDTCSRSCLAKIPMSTKRKICRYQCQVDACERIVKDLRRDMGRCAGLDLVNKHKCEKKLRGEFIKWSRRLQQQKIKLHQATLGVEEKERKKRAKELQKKAKQLAASFQIPRTQMLNMLAEDKRFRQLPFKYHIRLYQAISELKKSDQALAVKPPKIDPKKEKYARQALYLGLWVLPIPFFNDVVNYIIKKHNFACYGKCAAQRKFSQSLCRHQCSYLSAQYGVKMLNSQLAKCSKANNPVKCKKKILSMLEDWKQREVEAKIRFDAKLRKEIDLAKQREGKA
jgi:hypothetical protein